MTVLQVAELRGLYRKLVQEGFGADFTKEILSAAAGRKTSRLSIDGANRDRMQRLMDSFNLVTLFSDAKYLVAKDRGKAGWSNRFVGKAEPGSTEGVWRVYLARDFHAAAAARSHDMCGDGNALGGVLGIPRCCRDFYRAVAEQAFRKQGDFLPFTRNNTPGSPPFNHWTNYTGRYFGYSLLGFTACSFRCPAAAQAARGTFDLLSRIDVTFAQKFIRYQRMSVLYTENDGVFLLRGVHYPGDGLVSFTLAASTVAGTELAQHMSAADNLHCPEAHVAVIRRGPDPLVTLRENFSLCLF